MVTDEEMVRMTNMMVVVGVDGTVARTMVDQTTVLRRILGDGGVRFKGDDDGPVLKVVVVMTAYQNVRERERMRPATMWRGVGGVESVRGRHR